MIRRTRMRLEGKVAIVTGGSGGLGRGFALRLAEEGAKVVIADINLEGGKAIAAKIEAKGGFALALKVDISSEEDVQHMVKETIAKFGRIDILVNNAAIYGGMEPKPFYEVKYDEMLRHMKVNVIGQWLCAKAVSPYMKEQGKGKIINMSSAVFARPLVRFAPYTVGKAALLGLTRVMAVELGQYNICVNSVAPGSVKTEGALSLFSEEEMERRAQAGVIKRVSVVEDVTGLVAFLASDESDFISGQTIVVDGGRTLH
jgi:3-oxoacyl-[acyl-carrier protein] reductase